MRSQVKVNLTNENLIIKDFRAEIPNETISNKRIISYIKTSLSTLEEYIILNDIERFVKKVEMFANYLGYETQRSHCESLFETIRNPKYHASFKLDELNRIAITFHSSKGLEFEQVIIFASDYKLSNEQEIYNHYVATTRARSKLIIVYINGDSDAKQFADNINRILGSSNIKMRDIATVLNC